MARKSELEHFIEGMHALFMVTPWWVGLVAVGVVQAEFRGLMPWGLSSLEDKKMPFSSFLPDLMIMLSWPATLLVLGIWGWSLVAKALNRIRLDSQTGLGSIRELSWAEFEELLAQMFRRQGYAVERTGTRGGDGGVDVRLTRDGRQTVVQCKQWKAWKVGVPVVRELLGVMTSEGADAGIVVTSGRFTAEARTFAQANGIRLIAGEELAELVAAVRKGPPVPTGVRVSMAPPKADAACPACGSTMVKRIAKRGNNAGEAFWGCSRFPTCRGTRSM